MSQYPLPPKPFSELAPGLHAIPVPRQMPHQHLQSSHPNPQAWTASQMKGNFQSLPGLGTSTFSSPSEPVAVSNNDQNGTSSSLRQPLQKTSARAFVGLPPLELSHGSILPSTSMRDVQFTTDREEGEVSEVEMSKQVSTSRHGQQTGPGKSLQKGSANQRRSPPQGPRIDSRTHPIQGTSSTMTPNEPSIRTLKQSLDAGPVLNGVAGYRPEDLAISRAQPERSESNNDKTRGQALVTYPQTSSLSGSSDSISKEYLASQRANAKNFILAWHKHGYTFSQLVEEKLEASFLQGIYQELGIGPSEIDHPDVGQPASLQELHKVQDIPKTAPPIVQHTEDVVSPLTKVPQPPITVPLPPRIGKAPAAGIKLDTMSAATASANSNETSSTANAVHSTSLPTAGPRPPLVKPQPPIPDRQDYIARLMAAKSKKTGAQVEPASPVMSGGPIHVDISPKLSMKPAQVIEPARELGIAPVNQENQQGIDQNASGIMPLKNIAQDITPTAEDKRKAQTELARLRMQALESARNSAATKSGLSSVTASPGKPTTAKLPNRPLEGLKPNKAASEQLVVAESNLSKSASLEGSDSNIKSFSEEVALASIPESVLAPPSSTSLTSASTGQSVMPNHLPSINEGLVPGRIPGLFMTSPLPPSDIEIVHPEGEAPTALTAALANAAITATRSRKRPVASDFDYGPPSDLIKRPFGHVRSIEDDEGIIIEASDDETAPSEIQEVNDREQGEVQNAVSQVSTLGSSAVDSSIIASPFAPQTVSTQPSEKLHSIQQITIAGPESTASPGATKNLKLQEDQILAMKKRIAEMEQRRIAKALTSRATTPITPKSDEASRTKASSIAAKSVPEDNKVSPTLSKLADSELAPFTLTTENETGVNGRMSGPAEPESDEASSARAPPPIAAETQNTVSTAIEDSSMIKWRQKRKVEIETGLPLLDARSASHQSKLDLLKQQMKALEDAMQKEAEDKQRLIQELESLGVDTGGMPHAVLQSTKNDLMAQMDMQEGVKVDDTSTSGVDRDSVGHSSPPSSIRQQQDLATASANEDEDEAVSPTNVSNSSQPTAIQPYVPDNVDHNSSKIPAIAPGLPQSPAEDIVMDDAASESGEIDTDSSSSSASSPASSPATTAAAPATAAVEDLNPNLSLEDRDEGRISASNDPSIKHTVESSKCASEAPVESIRSISRTHVEGADTQLPTSPSASDDSDEYEPPEPLAGSPLRELPTQDVSMDSDSDYEPPDNIPDLLEVSKAPSTSSPIPDISSTASDPNQQPLPPEVEEDSIADKHTTEMQSTAASSPIATSIREMSDLPMHERFKPYESPLANFKAYRYHEKFDENVPGGLRSTTYSHNIDADKPICAYEVAGGTCNDSKCEGQHFRSINIGDDEILKQIGTSNPGNTDEHKRAYTLGLRQLVSDLRQKNIKDSGAVASEIFAYRRRFLGDPTRVLNL